jgi:DMSO/TMAO reductase YedYZ molybdopterin-dependent catalytic subunit
MRVPGLGWGRWAGFAVLMLGLTAWGQNYTPVTVVVTGPDGPVAGAEIQVTPGSPAGDKLIADEQGRAQLGMPVGEYKLHVSAQGFAAMDKALVVADKPQTVMVALGPAAASNGTDAAGPAPMSPGAVPLDSNSGMGTLPAGTGTQTTAAANVLTIIGTNGQRGVFTPQTLGEYPQKTVRVTDRKTNQQKTYGGVPLMDLLAHLGDPRMAMGKALAKYVVATGSDGFDAVLSVTEVDPELHEGTVLIADTVDGKPLDPKAGPFQLVVSEDKRPVRSVRNLVKIEVRTAE